MRGLIKRLSILMSVLVVILGLSSCSNNKESINTPVRNIEVIDNFDFKETLNGFSNVDFKNDNGTFLFEGIKSVNYSDLNEVDNLSCDDLIYDKVTIKFEFVYDSSSNECSIYAKTIGNNDYIEVETIYGDVFIDESGKYDALMDIDGEMLLLSELQNVGLIEQCGFFKKVLKKVAIATASVVVVSAVAAFTVATCGAGMAAVIAAGAVAGAITGGIAGGIISYTEYGKLDWKWIVGGAVIGGALGAVTGWGVGTIMGVGVTKTPEVTTLIDSANKGELGLKNTLISKGYSTPGTASYRSYYDSYNLLSKEIMSAKNPVIESSTGYYKWVVEGACNNTCGQWELVIDPVNKLIAHLCFVS